MRFLTVTALLLTAVTIPVLGGAVFALFLFLPLFLLGLAGVLAGLDDRTVQQHSPAMDATRWREGVSAVADSDRRARDVHAPARVDGSG